MIEWRGRLLGCASSKDTDCIIEYEDEGKEKMYMARPAHDAKSTPNLCRSPMA